jgi:hypothetical protein
MHELHALLREYDRARAYTDDLWKDLSPDEVTWRPHENSSAIGWHLGHQAHVAHFMIRNLTAAEPSPDPELDLLMDSAQLVNHEYQHDQWISEVRAGNLGHALPPDPTSDGLSRVDGYLVLSPYP